MNPITVICNSVASNITGGILVDMIVAIGAIIGCELIIVGAAWILKVLNQTHTDLYAENEGVVSKYLEDDERGL